MYKGFYDIKNDIIFIDPNLKGLYKLKWYLHEKIHQYLYKIFKLKIGKYINLIWDILDNSIFSISFYYNSFDLNSLRDFGGGKTEVTSHTYFYYKLKFPHNSLDPSQAIIFYNSYGEEVYTLPAYSEYMDYGIGVVSIPGSEQNTTIESVSTATYYVFYSTADLIIDYEQAEFKISKTLIKSTANTKVTSTFEYFSVITPFKDVASVIDGRWDTQVQTVFFAEPPTGYNYAILDLGSIKTIQAIDLVAGFYKPDGVRRFDIDYNMTLQYSTDGVNYYDISDKTRNIQFTGGSSKTFEEKDLGIGFTARYLKFILENVKKIEYGAITAEVNDSNRQSLIDQGIITSSTPNGAIATIRSGTFVVAITEISAYDNIVIKSEATLIPTTVLTVDVDLESASASYPTTINVLDTSGFDSSGVAYIWNGLDDYDIFTYQGKGTTFFWGVSGLNSDHDLGDLVVQEIEGDNNLYDYEYIRPKLGDRVYKVNKVNDETLYNQTQLDYLAKIYLLEFMKNHSKATIEVMFSPFLEVGMTIQIIDAINNVNDKYFIEAINSTETTMQLTVAKYPQ